MISHYQQYIASFLHNPNLFKKYFLNIFDVEQDSVEHRSWLLLMWSEYLWRNTKITSCWTASIVCEGLYPHFQMLYAFITGKPLVELQQFDKEQMLKHYSEEIHFLQKLYRTTPPVEQVVAEVPMLVDLFGIIHELKIETQSYYFNQVGPFGANIKCNTCKKATLLKAYNIIQLQVEPTDIAFHQYQHQCQSCGAFKFADLHNADEALTERCACGGHFRRDKPIICSNCRMIELGRREVLEDFE